MNCPNCGQEMGARGVCPSCGHIVTKTIRPSERLTGKGQAGDARRLAIALVWTISWIVSLSFMGLGAYKAYYWVQSIRMEQAYETGAATMPALDQLTLEDGRVGHAITFYGEDGDMIYIEELRRCYLVVGGVARVEVADSEWFDLRPEDVESAEITITPVSIGEDGARTMLPTMTLAVDAPYSPLALVSPPEAYTEVFSSIYPLNIQVVPGSTVLVDGEDVTDVVDRLGNLSVNVAVYPQGDNTISLLVETPHHKQTRQDIVLYRQQLEIELELSVNTAKTSTRSTLSVSGATEPGVAIDVDTAHVEDSIQVDAEGNFSFIAKFEKIGDNSVKFRAKREGKQDSVIAFTVKYVPTLAEYGKNAWVMDYEELSKYYATWQGRVFLCEGTVMEVRSKDPQVIILDVGDGDSKQLLALENQSGLGSVTIGSQYKAYADVSGTYNMDGNRIPSLIARYMSLSE